MNFSFAWCVSSALKHLLRCAFMCFFKDALVRFRKLDWSEDDVEEGRDSGRDNVDDVEEDSGPDKTNSRWLEMQKPRGSRPGLRETINLPLLRS